jgi:putative hydrolase of the HAD superfamily
VRTTIPILHERIFAPRGLEIDVLVDAIRSMWREVQAELKSESGSEDERWREVPAVEKYRRVLERIDGIDGYEVGEMAEQVAHAHHETLVSAAVLIDGAAEVLQRVREKGIPTVLVSNWDHARAGPSMLTQTGLQPLLDHVVISEAVGLRKPHPKIFTEALIPFAAAPAAALHIGDLAEADAWGAGRLGFKTVWIDRGAKGWPDELDPAPSLTVTRIADLLDRL